MSAPKLDSVRTRLETVIALARLLERVERAPSSASAEQYRALVLQLQQALDDDLPTDALNAVLSAYPASAEVYENLHYAQSGLSRTTLEHSVASEMQASQFIAKIAASSRQR
jgi:hypothetical protein